MRPGLKRLAWTGATIVKRNGITDKRLAHESSGLGAEDWHTRHTSLVFKTRDRHVRHKSSGFEAKGPSFIRFSTLLTSDAEDCLDRGDDQGNSKAGDKAAWPNDHSMYCRNLCSLSKVKRRSSEEALSSQYGLKGRGTRKMREISAS